MSQVVTRFAPSPTGFLHIGGARTALFNWLFARHDGGQYLLRVEDTDRARSTTEATQAIYDGLAWLGVDFDGEAVSQQANLARHQQVVQELLDKGAAYKCYCSKEELEVMREEAVRRKSPFRYNRIWRDKDPKEAPEDVAPVVRLKAPLEGTIIVEDLVQGSVEVAASELDDMVLLRSDGTPTYMLAVVVDDHDMGITHVIRGDDHLTNTFRQYIIYQALGWEVPHFAHIPLIHGEDGAKLSKRHGALGVCEYRAMGYLPEALCNYLLRLGWSHGDDEIISKEDAIKWFALDHVGKSPARFDLKKLDAVNGHYIRHADLDYLWSCAAPFYAEKLGRELKEDEVAICKALLPSLQERAKTLVELVDMGLFAITGTPKTYTEKAQKALDHPSWREAIAVLEAQASWSKDKLEEALRKFSEEKETGLGKIMGGIRAAITGSHASPSMFEVMEVLGRQEVLERLRNVV